MRFLADESCDFAVVRALRAAGHDVLAIVELSPQLQDLAVLEWGQGDVLFYLSIEGSCQSVSEWCLTPFPPVIPFPPAYFTVVGFGLVKEGLFHLGSFRLLLGAEPSTGEQVGLRPDPVVRVSTNPPRNRFFK